MQITSVIVETAKGEAEKVLASLARFPRVNVYGMQDDRIVTVIEGDSTEDIERAAAALAAIEWVVGVFPVYAGEYD